jgi:hypothetical protein
MGGPVERAYLVSVDDLRGICETLTDGKREYKLVCEGEAAKLEAASAGEINLLIRSFRQTGC